MRVCLCALLVALLGGCLIPVPLDAVGYRCATDEECGDRGPCFQNMCFGEDPLGLLHFTLIDARTDEPILAFDPLVSGDQITLSQLSNPELNVVAHPKTEAVKSVRFWLDGNELTHEADPPFSAFGDDTGPNGEDYRRWLPYTGRYVLTAIPYANDSGDGDAGPELTISFDVRD